MTNFRKLVRSFYPILLLGILFIPNFSLAAISTINSVSGSGTSVASLTLSLNVSGSEKLLFVTVGTGAFTVPARTVTSVTSNGVALTRAWSVDDGTWEHSEGWYLVNPPDGANSIVVTMPGSVNQIGAGATLFNGVNQSTPIGTAVTATSRTGQPALTVSSVSGDTVVAGIASDSETGITQTGTLLWKVEGVANDSSFGAQSYPGASSVSVAWTQTLGSTGWAVGGVSVKASGSITPPPPPPPTDTTPPIISSVGTANISSSGVTVSWSTNESATSQVQYGLTTAYGSSVNSGGTTSHSVTLSGLSANTVYNFRISATDTSGNTAVSTNQTFTTSAVVTPPPPTPTPPPPTPTPTPTPVPTSSIYPLKVGPTGRYLVDKNNSPFLIFGDSAHSLIGNVNLTDAATYLSSRNSAGVNSLWVEMFCSTYSSHCTGYTAYDGIAPFAWTGNNPATFDLAQPNESYFSKVDQMLSLANQYGITVFLDPAETGGWMNILRTNGATKAFNFGVYIGNRYKNYPNIVWILGNDFQTWTDPTDDNVMRSMAQGIKSVDTNHILTTELDFPTSASRNDSTWDTIINLDSAYSYYSTYDQVLREYNKTPIMPVYFLEGVYEFQGYMGGYQGPRQIRAQNYWTQLSGSAGQIYGNANIFPFGGNGVNWLTSNWQTSPGIVQSTIWYNFFKNKPWYNFVPDQNHTVVTVGYGTYESIASQIIGNTSNYVTTARNSDGSEVISYIPSTRTITVDMTKLSGPVTAKWMDPVNGNLTTISGSPFANTGTRQFTTPGNNAGGDTDWVLDLTAGAVVADTQAPTTPTGLATTPVSTSQINLSWTASTDNVGVTGYKVFRNGVQINTTTGTTYSDTGLTAATTYSYTVSSYDAAGNNSSQTTAVSGTTQSSVTPPPPPPPTPTGATEWYMNGANPQRTSYVSNEVPGNLQVEWYRTIDPYIDTKTQVIAAAGKLFVSTSKGLYAFNATNGTQAWVYGTEMPLGNSPTYSNGYVYVGGMDHRVYAIDATTGVLKPGWTFVEAGAGFETNPVVANGKVYLGNRDGYFYALDANDGHLWWKWQDTTSPQPDAPIRFSAAYKNNVLYFASDASYAYALQDNGSSASMIWRSAKFPGVGFATYWPVIYTNAGTDYVIFSGSVKATDWGWWESLGYHQMNSEIYSGVTGDCGASGTEPYLWLTGTPTINCTLISNYLTNTKPFRRSFFVLNASTGTEFTPYAPVNWAGVTHGGNKYPPIVGGDGVLYTHIGYSSGGNGFSHGWLAGWKFGTSYISKTYNTNSGASDEPVAYTAGGKMIYYAEGVNADTYGTIDMSKAFGSVGSTYSWNAAGVGGKYSANDLGGKFGGINGVYSYFDGVNTMSPVAYGGKLYLINANNLIAMSTTGGNRNAGSVSTPGTQQVVTLSTTYTDLQNKLNSEVQKIVNAGHLRPGFHDSGLAAMNFTRSYAPPDSVPGNHLGEYFTDPGTTLATLALAMPYLNTTLQTQVKTYLQNEQASYPVQSIAHIGWKNGAKREIYDDTSDFLVAANRTTDDPNSSVASIPRNYIQYVNRCCGTDLVIGNFPPDAFYGAWKYAAAVGLTTAQSKTLFDSMSSKLQVAGSGNNMTDANLIAYPYILNQYINGYRGYIELEKLAGYTTNITSSTKYAEYQRLIALRLNNYNDTPTWANTFSYNNILNVSRNFMYMTPELAEILRTNKLTAVQNSINTDQVLEPYWFVTKYDRTYGEGTFHPLYDYAGIFQAKAYILQQPISELAKYIDKPAFAVGDLYYIQNLVAALSSTGVTPTPPPPPTPDSIPPTVSFTSPTTGSTVSGTVNISASATDNNSVAGVQFKLDGANLGIELSVAPYTYSWNTTAVTSGSHTLVAVARDSSNNYATSSPVTVTVNNASGPYGGTAPAIPGTTIQAENFDIGGESIGYHDTDATNNGGQYRITEGVDIEATTDTGGGYDVGWIVAGEWMKYTVNVTQAGSYSFIARVASNGVGGTFHIEADGITVASNLTVPNTGGWQIYQDVPATFSLTSGVHAIKFVADTNGAGGFMGNFNYMTFSNGSVTPPPPPPASTKFTIGQRVQTTANVNVRATANTTGTLLGTQSTGALGTVIGGPTAQGGFNWWQINYDTGADGWSAEDFLVVYTAGAKTYYVSPTGSDSNTGLSQSVPFATFNKAFALMLPGDTLYLMDGIYKQQLYPTTSGTASGYIVIKALNDGKAVIDGDISGDGKGDVDPVLIEKNYIDLEGIVAINGGRDCSDSTQLCYVVGVTIGIRNGNNNILRRVSAYNAHTDINSPQIGIVGGNDNLIEDCVSGGSGRKMIYVYGSGTRNIIRRCLGAWQDWQGREFNPGNWPWGDTFETYNASNNLFENDIAYGMAPGPGSGFNIFAQSGATAQNNAVIGSMAVRIGMKYNNTQMTWPCPDPYVSTVTCTDMLAWDTRSGFRLGNFDGSTNTNNLFQDIFSYGNAGLGLNVSVYPGNTTQLVRGTFYSNSVANNTRFPGQSIGGQSSSPTSNLTITDSYIQGTTYQGGGAVITNRYQSSFDTSGNRVITLTSTPLWPWPMESRIQSEFATYLYPKYGSINPELANFSITNTMMSVFAAVPSALNPNKGTVTPPPPPPQSTKFTTGQRVQATANLNVRATADTAGTLLGTQSTGSLGNVVAGPTAQGGFNWWQINYDTGADGWSVEDFLTAVSTSTTPTPPPPPPTGPISISNIVVNTPTVAKFDKFEISFDVNNSVATNFQLPYDAAPPAGVDPANYPLYKGISVDAQFSPDNFVTVYSQPAFYYQYFTEANKTGWWDSNQHEWYYPTGVFGWKARFAPNTVGTWQVRLVARDASGSYTSPAQSFTVSASSNKGFIKVSSTDKRYFEFDDGSIFTALGFNDALRADDPILNNTSFYQKYQQNGINFLRVWIEDLYGTSWLEWLGGRNIYDGYLPRTGMEAFTDTTTGKTQLTQAMTYPEGWYDACRFQFWTDPEPVKQNTNYKLTIKYHGEGMTGPRVTSSPNFGLVGKITTAWLAPNCYDPNTGTPVTTYGGNNSGFGTVSGTWNSGTNNFLPRVYLAMENVNSGKVWIDSVSLKEDLGGGNLGPEIISDYSMQYETYYPQQESYGIDKIVDLAKQYGVYLKFALIDKNDMMFQKFNNDGTFALTADNPAGFYGSGRVNNRTRWLEKAYFRYLQARWGYSTSIHSWELTNEGDPWNTDHYALTDELGKVMHCTAFGISVGTGDAQKCNYNHPDDHLVTTSFWHSFPATQFWGNVNYPNVDYADLHAYISTSNIGLTSTQLTNMQWDSALYHLGHSSAMGGWNLGKPIVRGESGIDTPTNQTEQPALANDTQGIWLHKFLWSTGDSGAMSDLYWWTENIKAKPGPDGQTGLYDVFKPFSDFISTVPLNNGRYADLSAIVTNTNIRVVGQKDITNGKAYLWVDNITNNWKNVVDGIGATPASGTITFSGMPNGSYNLTSVNTYTGVGSVSSLSVTGNTVSIPISSLTTDVAYKLDYTGSVTPPPPPPSTKFTVGQRVQTSANVNVRSTADTAGTLLGTQSTGSLGNVVAGPTAQGGFNWWQINYDTGADGWSVEDFLIGAAATPIAGDLNTDHIINSLDWSIMNSQWFTSNSQSDLRVDGQVNSLDFAILSSNWGRTW